MGSGIQRNRFTAGVQPSRKFVGRTATSDRGGESSQNESSIAPAGFSGPAGGLDPARSPRARSKNWNFCGKAKNSWSSR